ncbi:MAG: hypothetical protein WBL63_20915 [Candidatus Acidiferrum sp.]
MTLPHFSFERKLSIPVLAVTVFAPRMTCMGLALYEWNNSRNARTNEFSRLASTLGRNSAASMASSDRKTTAARLVALQVNPDIPVTHFALTSLSFHDNGGFSIVDAAKFEQNAYAKTIRHF